MTKYKIRRESKNGIIRYVQTPIEESEELDENVTIEDDHKDREIARLTALIDKLTKEITKLESKPKEEAPSSDVMAVAAASTYDCYK